MMTMATMNAAVCGVLAAGWLAGAAVVVGAEYGDPAVFADELGRLEAGDGGRAVPAGAIVCAGSSSMRLWHPTLARDLAPLTVIPRGFGGSTMNDALHYLDRLVLRYRPRAVLLYEGDNDIAQGIAPERVADGFRTLVGRVHASLPEARIYYLSIKPSIARWKLWPRMQEANRLIGNQCAADKRLTYIDVATVLLGPDGRPRKELLEDDGLHLNRAGYQAWREVVRPVLLAGERAFEQAAPVAEPMPVAAVRDAAAEIEALIGEAQCISTSTLPRPGRR